ncbi:MAG: hypothetical protein ACFE9Z_13820 [Promethearchaeota archaeon]
MLELSTYIEFKEGNIPLIFSVPHGGSLDCDSIPQRSNGILGIDKGTMQLTIDLVKEIKLKYKEQQLKKKWPFYIISKLRRSRIDLNRQESNAFDQNSFIGREIYNFYHSKILKWINVNLQIFDKCLLIDIHGFEKKDRPSGFRDVEIILGTNNLKSFFPNPIPKRDWGNNIRAKIIKAFLELNIPIAPGHPRRREYVLTGGYITKKYGASHIPKNQTIQIEFSDNLRLYNNDLRRITLKTLADVLFQEYLN